MDYQLYKEQERLWPAEGQHILANYDEESISVYQAYRPAIADYAVHHQRFGGEFSFTRMSWIKPNFLWMMYRSGWATKEGQERILEIRINRRFFDEILKSAVASSFSASHLNSVDAWKQAIEKSEVRLQWDPDHDPYGKPLKRRAIQLGLRGNTLKSYATTEIKHIRDITDFVLEQRANIGRIEMLTVPQERIYPTPERAAIEYFKVGKDAAL